MIAPLDWGLGHTTRCIPIIKELLHLNKRVIVACNSWQEGFLKQEFPSLTTVFLPGYDIRYSSTKSLTSFKISLQIPKILTVINRENRILRRIVYENAVDLIISDNRYGLFHGSVLTVFITHQLSPLSGFGKVIDRFSHRQLAKYINRFNEVWVPDTASATLAGVLSRTNQFISVSVKSIGPLSRFSVCPGLENRHIAVVLSGPEPQRSIFERLIIDGCAGISEPIVIVRGTTNSLDGVPPPNVTIIDRADSSQLNEILCKARIVISRSGYTSLMDIIKLKKKWIAVPTPGQAEQEYLGLHIQSNGWALCTSQNSFQLKKALAEADVFAYRTTDIDTEKYKQVIREFFGS